MHKYNISGDQSITGRSREGEERDEGLDEKLRIRRTEEASLAATGKKPARGRGRRQRWDSRSMSGMFWKEQGGSCRAGKSELG